MVVSSVVGNEVTTSNPFPGPVPYGPDDEYFFGREEDVAALTSLVLSSSAVVLDAPSGTGKSSLINARLIPSLRDEFCEIHEIECPKMIIDEGAPRPEMNPLLQVVPSAFWSRADRRSVDGPREVRRHGGKVSKHLLVLDQFEALFFRYPRLWSMRDGFFRTLGSTLWEDSSRRLLIAVRSDYLERLWPYFQYLPGESAVGYRLPDFSGDEARQVVRQAFDKSGRPLEDEVLSQLLDALVNKDGYREQYVNLVVLQIACRKLWEQGGVISPPPPTSERFWTDRSRSDRPKSDRGALTWVSTAMVDFVDQAIQAVLQESDADEARVRDWLAAELITAAGHRGFVRVEEEPDGGLKGRVVGTLEKQRLVTAEQRNQERLVELTHDSMVGAVEKSNRHWNELRTRKRTRRIGLLLAWLLVLGLILPALHNGSGSASVAPRTSSGIAGTIAPQLQFSTSPDTITVVSAYTTALGTSPKLRLRGNGQTATVNLTAANTQRLESSSIANQSTLSTGSSPKQPAASYTYIASSSGTATASIEGLPRGDFFNITVLKVPLVTVGDKLVHVDRQLFGVAVSPKKPLVVTAPGDFSLGSDVQLVRAGPSDGRYRSFLLDGGVTASALIAANADSYAIFEPTGGAEKVYLQVTTPFTAQLSRAGGPVTDATSPAIVLRLPPLSSKDLGFKVVCSSPFSAALTGPDWLADSAAQSSNYQSDPLDQQYLVGAAGPLDSDLIILTSGGSGTAASCKISPSPPIDLGTVDSSKPAIGTQLTIDSPLKVGSPVGAVFHTTADSVVVVDPPTEAKASLACERAAAQSSTSDEIVELIQGQQSCTLLLSPVSALNPTRAKFRLALLPAPPSTGSKK
jgi:hypothetical protein